MLAVCQDLLDVPFYFISFNLQRASKRLGKQVAELEPSPAVWTLGYFRLTGLTPVKWVTAHTTWPPGVLPRGRENTCGPAWGPREQWGTQRKTDAALRGSPRSQQWESVLWGPSLGMGSPRPLNHTKAMRIKPQEPQELVVRTGGRGCVASTGPRSWLLRPPRQANW